MCDDAVAVEDLGSGTLEARTHGQGQLNRAAVTVRSEKCRGTHGTLLLSPRAARDTLLAAKLLRAVVDSRGSESTDNGSNGDDDYM